MKKAPKSREREAVLADFRSAIARLKAGKPKEARNRADSANSKLKINALTVSREAGRSRTLIGAEDCAYPEIRAEIRGRLDDALSPRTAAEAINRLRAEVREANRLLHLAQAEILTHYRARRQAEGQAASLSQALERARSKRREDEKIVKLVTTSPSDSPSNNTDR